MPDNHNFVTDEEFKAALAWLLLRQQEHAELVTALSLLLMEKGMITPEEFHSAALKAQNTNASKRSREALAKLAESVTIQDILKNFQGPIQ